MACALSLGGLRAVPKYGFRMRAPNLRAPKRKGPNDRGHALNQEEKIQDDSHRKCEDVYSARCKLCSPSLL